MSASTRATFNPRWQRLEIKNFARVLFPVSVAPRIIAMPFSFSRISKRGDHSLGPVMSMKTNILRGGR
jgi:hypothetical protein